jgi:hypothetical protein
MLSLLQYTRPKTSYIDLVGRGGGRVQRNLCLFNYDNRCELCGSTFSPVKDGTNTRGLAEESSYSTVPQQFELSLAEQY